MAAVDFTPHIVEAASSQGRDPCVGETMVQQTQIANASSEDSEALIAEGKDPPTKKGEEQEERVSKQEEITKELNPRSIPDIVREAVESENNMKVTQREQEAARDMLAASKTKDDAAEDSNKSKDSGDLNKNTDSEYENRNKDSGDLDRNTDSEYENRNKDSVDLNESKDSVGDESGKDYVDSMNSEQTLCTNKENQEDITSSGKEISVSRMKASPIRDLNDNQEQTQGEISGQVNGEGVDDMVQEDNVSDGAKSKSLLEGILNSASTGKTPSGTENKKDDVKQTEDLDDDDDNDSDEKGGEEVIDLSQSYALELAKKTSSSCAAQSTSNATPILNVPSFSPRMINQSQGGGDVSTRTVGPQQQQHQQQQQQQQLQQQRPQPPRAHHQHLPQMAAQSPHTRTTGPKTQPRKPSAAAAALGKAPAETAPMKPTVDNNCNTLNPDNQKVIGSAEKPVGWTSLAGTVMPYLMRGKTKYVSVKMVEAKLLSKYPNIDLDEMTEANPIFSYYVNEGEAKLLSEINTKCYNGAFGKEKFTTKDLIVSLQDFEKFYKNVEIHFEKLKMQRRLAQAAEAQKRSIARATKKAAQRRQAMQMATGGWLQINNTVCPYVVRSGIKYVPVQVVKYAAKLLIGVDLAQNEFSTTEDEIKTLNSMCQSANVPFKFKQDTTDVMKVEMVVRLNEIRVNIKELPKSSPISSGVYDEEIEVMKEAHGLPRTMPPPPNRPSSSQDLSKSKKPEKKTSPAGPKSAVNPPLRPTLPPMQRAPDMVPPRPPVPSIRQPPPLQSIVSQPNSHATMKPPPRLQAAPRSKSPRSVDGTNKLNPPNLHPFGAGALTTPPRLQSAPVSTSQPQNPALLQLKQMVNARAEATSRAAHSPSSMAPPPLSSSSLHSTPPQAHTNSQQQSRIQQPSPPMSYAHTPPTSFMPHFAPPTSQHQQHAQLSSMPSLLPPNSMPPTSMQQFHAHTGPPKPIVIEPIDSEADQPQQMQPPPPPPHGGFPFYPPGQSHPFLIPATSRHPLSLLRAPPPLSSARPTQGTGNPFLRPGGPMRDIPVPRSVAGFPPPPPPPQPLRQPMPFTISGPAVPHQMIHMPAQPGNSRFPFHPSGNADRQPHRRSNSSPTMSAAAAAAAQARSQARSQARNQAQGQKQARNHGQAQPNRPRPAGQQQQQHQKPPPLIKPIMIRGKTVSCLLRSTSGGGGQRYALVEALLRLYFNGCGLATLKSVLRENLQIPLEELTPDEEREFIRFYDLPVKSLKCKTVVLITKFESFFDAIELIMKDKKVVKEAAAAAAKSKLSSTMTNVSASATTVHTSLSSPPPLEPAPILTNSGTLLPGMGSGASDQASSRSSTPSDAGSSTGASLKRPASTDSGAGGAPPMKKTKSLGNVLAKLKQRQEASLGSGGTSQ